MSVRATHCPSAFDVGFEPSAGPQCNESIEEVSKAPKPTAHWEGWDLRHDGLRFIVGLFQ